MVVARSLTSAAIVQRVVARALPWGDIEAATGGPGRLVRWQMYKVGGAAATRGHWMWEIEPGGSALVVEESDGLAGQPVIRPLQAPPHDPR